jgi:hypothetical protein
MTTMILASILTLAVIGIYLLRREVGRLGSDLSWAIEQREQARSMLLKKEEDGHLTEILISKENESLIEWLDQAHTAIKLWERRASIMEARDIVDADARQALRAIEIALSGGVRGRTPHEVIRLAEMAVDRRRALIVDDKSRAPDHPPENLEMAAIESELAQINKKLGRGEPKYSEFDIRYGVARGRSA